MIIMQFYWRILEELRYLGETLIFHDPNLARQYRWWLRKNYLGVAYSSVDHTPGVDRAFMVPGDLRSLN